MPGQAIPVPVTVPEPLPANTTERLCGGMTAKVAVTFWSLLIVTVQVAVPLHPPPDQPLKLEPDAAAAVSVTTVPAA